MSISDERVQEFKKIFKEENGKEMSDEEAREAGENLVGFFEILWKMAQREAQLERQLKKEPKGFPVEGDFSCLICGQSVNEINGWYHWGGPRCLLCHKAVVEGIVPKYLLHPNGRDSYYHTWQLKSDFSMHSQTARKLVRLGELKARIILTESGKPYEYIFLKKENPQLIDPNRYSPGRKSYERNRKKISDALIRKDKKEWREKIQKEKTEFNKKYKLK